MSFDSTNWLLLLFDEVLLLSEPFIQAYDPWARRRLLRDLGWDLDAISGFSAADFERWLDKVAPALEELTEALARVTSNADTSVLEKFWNARGPVSRAFSALKTLPPSLQGKLPDIAGLPEAMGDDLVDYLLLTYLARRQPWLIHVLALLGLVIPAEEQPASLPMPPGDAPIRLPRRRDALRLDRVADLVTDPTAYFKNLYASDGWESPEAVARMATRILPRLSNVLSALGVEARYGVQRGRGPDLGEVGERLTGHLLRLRFAGTRPETGSLPAMSGKTSDVTWRHGVVFGATVGLIPDDGGPGLLVIPTGEVQLTGSIGSWNVDNQLQGAGEAFLFSRRGVNVLGGTNSGTPSVTWHVELAKIAPHDELGWVIGAPGGTHLAFGQLALDSKVVLGTGRNDIAFGVRARRAEIVLSVSDGDGLLKRLLPAEGFRIEFELGIGWSLRNGLHWAGSAALVAEYPMHLSRWGLHVEGLRIALSAASAESSLRIEVSTSLRAELGPVRIDIIDVGARADVLFGRSPVPDQSPNWGRVHFQPGFKLPTGVGLRVDASLVEGGGHLSVDEQRGSYAGMLQLGVASKAGVSALRGFSLQAAAILNTKKPDGTRLTEADGSETFSLLVAGSVQWFPGLPLFWGISLSGLGLVVGYNRRTNSEEIRSAVRAGSIDSLLFPSNATKNADSILAALSRMFPPDPSGTVLGAMVRLDWLNRRVLADLAVLVEFPEPVRILLLGKVIVEFEKAGKLRLDSVGILDFSRRQVSLDAALVDSNLFGKPITGEMAMRAHFGTNRSFAFSIGGFHPRYRPPRGFPELKRVRISLKLLGDGPTLSAYLAVTSNSLQLGAAIELHLEQMGFVLDGRAHLDAICYWKPFSFSVNLGALVSVKYEGATLLAVAIEMLFNGTHPWRIRGEARFQFLGLDVRKRFSWKHGDEQLPPPAPTVNAAELLHDALSAPSAWQVSIPAEQHEPVVLRAQQSDERLWLSPGALLGIRQNLLPLGVRLHRLGTLGIEGPDTFHVKEVHVGDPNGELAGVLGEAILDDFAPGQFRKLSLLEQVMSADFETHEAGRWVSFPDGSALPSDPLTVYVDLSSDAAYDALIIDDPDEAARPLPEASFATGAKQSWTRFAATGPAAHAKTRRSGSTRFLPSLATAKNGVGQPQRSADTSQLRHLAAQPLASSVASTTNVPLRPFVALPSRLVPLSRHSGPTPRLGVPVRWARPSKRIVE